MSNRLCFWKLICAVLAFGAPAAFAADYPDRPIRFIVPFSPGGGLDIVARLIAPKLSERLHQQVIVDNRPGASGTLGTTIAANATPNGYTFSIGNVGTHAADVSLYKKLSYDPVKDFTPITQIARVTELLVVNPSLPVHSVKELIALAKSKPGQLNFGSSGRGTTPHLAAILFNSMTQIDMVHIPYKGIAPALTALIGGQINMCFSNIISVLPHVNAGRLRALGVSSAKRSRVAPEIPTIAEAGVPGYEIYNWYGIFVPRGTPQDIVGLLNREIVAVLQSKEISDRLTSAGADIITSTPEEFGRFVREEVAKYARVVKAGGGR